MFIWRRITITVTGIRTGMNMIMSILMATTITMMNTVTAIRMLTTMVIHMRTIMGMNMTMNTATNMTIIITRTTALSAKSNN